MALQQLAFGGVSRISYCSRCKKPLSNPISVDAGMGPICRGHKGKDMGDICERDEFSDEEDSSIPLSQMLVLRRDGDDDHAIVRTNVPHLVVHHSPSGFEWGYGGSGPADLALNICQWYLNHMGYEGEKSECFDGNCFSLAFVLHQDFKWKFITSAPHNGITIPMEDLAQWFDEHITEDMKRMYARVQNDELE